MTDENKAPQRRRRKVRYLPHYSPDKLFLDKLRKKFRLRGDVSAKPRTAAGLTRPQNRPSFTHGPVAKFAITERVRTHEEIFELYSPDATTAIDQCPVKQRSNY